ncbi:MAG: histidine--tRNA ligase [Alphaproteobacteria bacterium]
MAQRVQPVRGMHDILPEDGLRHRHVVDTARRVAGLYGYQPIATPIVEPTAVFQRTLGETSDIVSKEMYSFDDRGGESLTLRPEGTAGVARAFITAGLAQATPCKFFYDGPMFRYERPQKGRQRQFHQVGVELIGAPEPEGDAEVVAMGARFLEALALQGNTVLHLNSLGDAESRGAYRAALVDFLRPKADRLSEDSRLRLERNPLRILDSKDEGDRALIADAPRYDAYLNQDSRDFFAAVRRDLDRLGIAYEVDPKLVRGLDYYVHTAFEFVSDALGAQATVLAGGRYDGLIAAMGGPETPGVGWAAGVERLAMLCAAPPAPRRPVTVVPVSDGEHGHALALADRLRAAGLPVDVGFRGNLKKRMKHANRVGARAALILGEDEVARGVAKLRDLDTGAEEDVALDRLAAACAALLAGGGPGA